ncbi:MAG: methyltransferase domain-containing protein [Magnetospiraceae bacterium]
MEQRMNADVIRETLSLNGKKVADIGCGDGTLVRMMTREGAEVIGVDPNPVQMERAQAHALVGTETYVSAGGEDLPFDDDSLDIVIFFNSLHHVPLPLEAPALAEAYRVLRPGGTLYVAEPVADGPFFHVTRLVDDETVVRSFAQGVLSAATWMGYMPEADFYYMHEAKHASFDALKTVMTAINPDRKALVEELEPTLRARFDELGEARADGIYFQQPMHATVLRKPA